MTKEKIEKIFNHIDIPITNVLKKMGLPFLRYALALVFIWFGLLKPLGMSPAAELVAKIVYWFDPSWFVPFLGWWEVVIGICFLWKPLTRVGILLMVVQLLGTSLPFFIMPEVVFGKIPYALTLEGEFIIKNLVLLAAGLVVGSTAREKK